MRIVSPFLKSPDNRRIAERIGTEKTLEISVKHLEQRDQNAFLMCELGLVAHETILTTLE